MKFGSLFSGIGGFDLGLERAGMECAWQVEIDSYATKVIEKHWPKVKRYKDVRECGKHNLESVDLICGGFPCQPHSLAGKRKASSDERDLWGEFARIICELRPRYVVAENVPGLLSSESGRFFGRVLSDLAKIGYDAEWRVLSAAQFGAPHQRDRVWIVAHSNGSWELQSERLEQVKRGRIGNGGKALANANNERSQGWRSQVVSECSGEQPAWESGSFLPDTSRTIIQRNRTEPDWEQNRLANNGWWEVEPDVGRVADGIPKRVDRLKCLGNAVVPQIVEWIGRQILATHSTDAGRRGRIKNGRRILHSL